MMDLQTLRQVSKEAGARAKKTGVQPTVFTEREITKENVGRRLANVGSFLPKGWARVSLNDERIAGEADGGYSGIYMADNEGFGAYFVDKSGFGEEGEAALTVDAFVKKIKPGLGYGIVEEGQFQIKVGVFAVRTDH